ncbi:hypothetical protein ADUPG1_001216, partial [Aduncisulcus paluster]
MKDGLLKFFPHSLNTSALFHRPLSSLCVCECVCTCLCVLCISNETKAIESSGLMKKIQSTLNTLVKTNKPAQIHPLQDNVLLSYLCSLGVLSSTVSGVKLMDKYHIIDLLKNIAHNKYA